MLHQALYFDVRKGAHSIGSSVRDAAAYVIWAIARSQDASALRSYSVDLAQKLVTVSLFDREIHIRRAASAAFQENVGRTVRLRHVSSVSPLIYIYCTAGVLSSWYQRSTKGGLLRSQRSAQFISGRCSTNR